jgi:hypothetical protein
MTGMARSGVAALVGILLYAPAVGQSPSPKPKGGPDPNEIVCEKEQVLGSRLQTRRVCMTRAERADRRKEDREYLEREQTERGMIQPG